MTIHKSQGTTVDHSHLLLDKHTDRHLAYVGMTRHKESLNLYYHTGQDNTHAVRNFDHLVHLSSQDNTKELVSDYQKITDFKENGISHQQSITASIGEKLHEFKDWLYEKVERTLNTAQN